MMFAADATPEVRAALPAADRAVQLGDFMACDNFDVLARLAEIRLRSLVLVGDRDRMTPEKYGRSLSDALGAELEVVAGAGHMLPLEASEHLSRSIDAFLAGGAG
jgi:pimeloyl-ACP methyl ester carboxylesterase